jgi:hypothetical protein
MNILSLGRRRLKIDIRVERLPDKSSSQAEQVYLNQKVREAALAERSHWELDHLSRAGWLR